MNASQLTYVASDIRQLTASFRTDLISTLGQNLIAIYLLGSIAFPRFEPRSGDIDFYVLLRRPLTLAEKKTLDTIHRKLSHRLRFGKALDGFYIPLTKASRKTTPLASSSLLMGDYIVEAETMLGLFIASICVEELVSSSMVRNQRQLSRLPLGMRSSELSIWRSLSQRKSCTNTHFGRF